MSPTPEQWIIGRLYWWIVDELDYNPAPIADYLPADLKTAAEAALLAVGMDDWVNPDPEESLSMSMQEATLAITEQRMQRKEA